MSRTEMSVLAAQLKQVLREFVPEQNITAVGSFFPDSDDMILELRITLPKGYQIAREAVAV